MQELTASINTKNVIDLEKAASFLGISTATVRNWVKCGHLKTYTDDKRYFFHLSNIENVKANITNDNLKKLKRNFSIPPKASVPAGDCILYFLYNGILVYRREAFRGRVYFQACIHEDLHL